MGKISFEWVEDRNGNRILQATKKRGNISITELQEVMREDYNLCGNVYAIVFPVHEDGGYQGWGDEENKGDVLFLYQYADWEPCPICFKDLVVDYCPHCGEKIREEQKNG